jgi:hypothetical protein
MYVRMYNTYIHTYKHTYIHTYMHTYIHGYIQTYKQTGANSKSGGGAGQVVQEASPRDTATNYDPRHPGPQSQGTHTLSQYVTGYRHELSSSPRAPKSRSGYKRIYVYKGQGCTRV